MVVFKIDGNGLDSSCVGNFQSLAFRIIANNSDNLGFFDVFCLNLVQNGLHIGAPARNEDYNFLFFAK